MRCHASTVRSAGRPGSLGPSRRVGSNGGGSLTRTGPAKIAANTATTATVTDTIRSIGEGGSDRPIRIARSDQPASGSTPSRRSPRRPPSGKAEEPPATGEPEGREHLRDREAASDEGEGRADPGQERPLVREREPRVGIDSLVELVGAQAVASTAGRGSRAAGGDRRGLPEPVSASGSNGDARLPPGRVLGGGRRRSGVLERLEQHLRRLPPLTAAARPKTKNGTPAAPRPAASRSSRRTASA